MQKSEMRARQSDLLINKCLIIALDLVIDATVFLCIRFPLSID